MVTIILTVTGGVTVGAILGAALLRPCLCRWHGQTQQQPRGTGSGEVPVWTSTQVERLVAESLSHGQAVGRTQAEAESVFIAALAHERQQPRLRAIEGDQG